MLRTSVRGHLFPVSSFQFPISSFSFMSRRRLTLIATVVVLVSLAALICRRALRPSPQSAQQSLAGSGPCVDFHQAGPHAGETTCVSGRVLRVFTSRAGNVFLDFCSDYHNCPFSSVIFSSDRNKFGDLTTLEGHQVEIRGAVQPYNGRAEIIIRQPRQIRVAD